MKGGSPWDSCAGRARSGFSRFCGRMTKQRREAGSSASLRNGKPKGGICLVAAGFPQRFSMARGGGKPLESGGLGAREWNVKPGTGDANVSTMTEDPETNTTATPVPSGNLEITVSRAELLRELTAAQSVVERKTTIPILSNFLFEATAEATRTAERGSADDHRDRSGPEPEDQLRGQGEEARRLHHSGAQAVRLHQAAARRRHLDQADGQPLGADPRRPLEHQDGRHGARELPAGAGVPGDRRVQDRRCASAEEHDRRRRSSPSRTRSRATR